MDLPAGGPGHVLHRHPSSATALAFAPRGEWIASGANQRTCTAWPGPVPGSARP
ncbi:MAG: hypothetical protein KIT35_15975 [Piscinibacter sp.]|uniref:WD40 repeat domain-containing protein n=1 Tax=Piscinibacter TaxID=1114981 RepID=UPI0013E3FAAF|nr:MULTISPECIES: WD40 repeat domain-containing protein [Piscinibacter]MCW5665330.1 hypothetical protein [Piscinibacter sp.]